MWILMRCIFYIYNNLDVCGFGAETSFKTSSV